MEWGPILAGVLAIAGILLKIYVAKKPARDERKRKDVIQEGRQDIVDGNVGAVESRIDGLLDEAGGSNAGSAGGESHGGADNIAGRLADLGISVSKDPGKSGTL